MRLLIRTVLGLALLAAGLTFFDYGLAQAIENGSCGTDKYGRAIGPACPGGFGPMILLMILGVFIALAGSIVFASRRPGIAALGGLFIFLAGLFGTGIAAAVIGIVDLHADDTRPGYEIVVLVLAAVLLLALPGLVRGERPAPGITSVRTAPQPATAFTPAPSAASADGVAARLRQLDQLRDAGLVGGDEYSERRRQILAEL